jgi:hypothetical protein
MCLRRTGFGVPGIPVLTGVRVEEVNPGDYIDNELLTESLKVLDSLQEELVASLAEVFIATDKQLRLYTMERVLCYFGPAVDIQEKGAVIAQVLIESKARNAVIEYINVSSVDKPAVKYK